MIRSNLFEKDENKIEKKEVSFEEGDWVLCEGYESAGFVISINEQGKTFYASFFTEYSDLKDEGGTAEFTLPLEKIESVITDSDEVKNLEEEMKRRKKLKRERQKSPKMGHKFAFSSFLHYNLEKVFIV